LAVTGLAGGPAGAEAPRARIAAHRGGALLWPENTLTAFRGALALGVDLVELDVHQTRDGEIVVLHDPTLERTTSGQGALRDLAWADVAAVTVKGDGAPPPRLAEVLDLLRPTGAGLLLEIKVGPGRERYPGIEGRVVARLAAAGLLERTTVMAFEWDTLERLRALSPAVRLTGLLSEQGAGRTGGLAAAARRLRSLGAHDLGIEWSLLGPEALRVARAEGLTIGVWTVNDADTLARALASGVDYVTTDRPDLALRLRGRR
jgi:glycerophosphoryl diester phosphodiesterase